MCRCGVCVCECVGRGVLQAYSGEYTTTIETLISNLQPVWHSLKVRFSVTSSLAEEYVLPPLGNGGEFIMFLRNV